MSHKKVLDRSLLSNLLFYLSAHTIFSIMKNKSGSQNARNKVSVYSKSKIEKNFFCRGKKQRRENQKKPVKTKKQQYGHIFVGTDWRQWSSSCSLFYVWSRGSKKCPCLEAMVWLILKEFLARVKSARSDFTITLKGAKPSRSYFRDIEKSVYLTSFLLAAALPLEFE